MKNLSVLMSTLALIGVIALAGLRMTEKKPAPATSVAINENTTGTTGRIAYINIDTLKEKYELYKIKKSEFEEKEKAMTSELQRSGQKFQQDLLAAQRKADAGTLTQAEYDATTQRLQQMKQSLETREAALTEKLLAEQDEFNKNVQKRLDDFLKEYNKDKGYDYVLSYSKSLGFIMLTNDQLDITEDVVNGMNELYKKEADKETKDTKKKNK
ncbi:MAG: OmpH family outer membrane protein [Taibaiella sp.]|nr:OmpH family outer membrane protein [Taibaiella sp.]